MSGWDLYWLMRLDAISEVANGLSMFSAFVLGSIFVFGLITYDDWADDAKIRSALVAKILGAVLVVSGIFSLLCPTTNEAAMIIIGPKIYNSDLVQEDLGKESKELYGLAKAWLKEKAEVKETSNE